MNLLKIHLCNSHFFYIAAKSVKTLTKLFFSCTEICSKKVGFGGAQTLQHFCHFFNTFPDKRPNNSAKIVGKCFNKILLISLKFLVVHVMSRNKEQNWKWLDNSVAEIRNGIDTFVRSAFLLLKLLR